MKKILFVLVCGLIGINSHAQVERYTFSQANKTFDTLTTGKVLGSETTVAGTYFIADSTGSNLGSTSIYTGTGIPIGFNFVYNDSTFNVFGVNADGWISFGKDSVDMNSSNVTTPISATSIASLVLQNRVSALGNILAGQPGSQLSYATSGIVGSRILVVEWKRYTRSAIGDTINFQIILHEGTNVVEFTYGKFTCSATSSNAQVGLRGTTNTDYLNRATVNHWNFTTAGIANTSTCKLVTGVVPDSSRTFIYTPPFHTDGGVTVFNYPVSSLLSPGSSKVAVTIKNFGTDTITTDSICWSVNGVLQAPFYWSGKLAYDSISKHDTIGSYNFATAGAYIIKAWSRKPNGTPDQNNSNDTAYTSIYVGGYASLPFVENFDGTWINFQNTRDVPSVYWTNNPSTGNGSWRRNDDAVSASWTLPDSGAYSPTGANGTTNSARFHSGVATSGTIGILDAHINFSTTGTKMLNFWYHNSSGTDSLAIYGSTNGGTSWVLIKKYYISTTWRQYSVNLGSSTGTHTILRFKATSNNTYVSDIGIDNIQVYILQPCDLAAVAWVAPTGGCGMTGAETVTVKFANIGTSKVAPPIALKYSTNNFSGIVTENYLDTVPIGDTVTYSFVTTANFTGTGLYHCGFCVKKSGDISTFNDTVRKNIASLGKLSGNPFVDSLENGNYHYTLTNGANSSIALAALVGNQSSHGFYCNGGATGTWAGGPTTTTSHQAFSYTDHVAKINTCTVDASAYPANNLYLKFDLKQAYSTGNKYSYFTVVLNRTHGIDTLSDISGTKYFNPSTPNSDPFAHKIFNLSAYVDSSFTLEFASACNTVTDSVRLDNITLSAKPTINLRDTTVCNGTILNAGAAPSGYTYLYNWSTKKHPATIATTQTIHADSAAFYFVTVNNGFGVTAKDSAIVGIFPVPVDSLVRYDTGCAPSVTLNPGVFSSYTYLWSTTAITPTITVSSSGPYWVDVKNSHGCVTRDSAFVDVIPLATVTTFPQMVCYLDSLYITDATAANYDSLRWTTNGDGHFNNSKLLNTIYKVGPNDVINTTVTLKLTAYSTCGSVYSTMVVYITTAPTINAGTNDTICRGNNVHLSASGATTYQWSPSTGLSSTSIANPIADPTKTTTYTVTGTSSCGSAFASVKVVVDSITAPTLGPNDTICANNSQILNAGAGYHSYLWSTGQVGQSITVDSATAHTGIGTLKVYVDVTKGACTASDTIKVTFDVCTGIAEYSHNASISIFPNPTTGKTNIILNGITGSAVLDIYSMLGQSVFSENVNGNNKTELDLSNLPKGVYFVKVNNVKTSILSKLIIQ